VLEHARSALQRLAATENEARERLTQLFEDQLSVLSAINAPRLTSVSLRAVA
jgi:hypothetical protein